jgi:hypothetical protein
MRPHRAPFVIAMVVTLATAAHPLRADVTITLTQNGSDVDVTGGGTLDTTDLTGPSTNFSTGGIFPEYGVVITGPPPPTAR